MSRAAATRRSTGSPRLRVRVVAAAVRGTAHAREGVPCQDAWAYAVEGDRVCAVVCDGAGSAAAGRSGALVGSAILVEALRRANLRGVPSTPAAQRPGVG